MNFPFFSERNTGHPSQKLILIQLVFDSKILFNYKIIKLKFKEIDEYK